MSIDDYHFYVDRMSETNSKIKNEIISDESLKILKKYWG